MFPVRLPPCIGVDLFSDTERIHGLVVIDTVIFAITNTKVIKIETKNFFRTPQVIKQLSDAEFKGICFDGKQTIYVTESNNHKIYRMDITTEEFEEFLELPGIEIERHYHKGRQKIMHYCKPWGLAIEHNGNILVTECHLIRRIH